MNWISICSIVVGLITVFVSVVKFYLDRRDAKRGNKEKIGILLNEAKDLMEGSEGAVGVTIYVISTEEERRVLENAKRKVDTALTLDPKNLEALHYLGIYYLRMGQMRNASETYSKALKLKSRHSSANNGYGITLHRQGNLEKAIKHFRKAIRANPHNPLAFINLANTLYDQGKLIEARKIYDQAIVKDVGSALPYIGIGNIYLKQRRYENAIACYDTAKRLCPDSNLPYLGIAIYHMELGNIEEAVNNYQISITLNPKDPTNYIGLGDAFKKRGESEKALQMYNKLEELNPTEFSTFLALGDRYAELNKKTEAIISYRKAIRKHMLFGDACQKVLDGAWDAKAAADTLNVSTFPDKKNDCMKSAIFAEAISIYKDLGGTSLFPRTDYWKTLSKDIINRLISCQSIEPGDPCDVTALAQTIKAFREKYYRPWTPRPSVFDRGQIRRS